MEKDKESWIEKIAREVKEGKYIKPWEEILEKVVELRILNQKNRQKISQEK